MNLLIHELSHLVLSFTVGYFVYRYYKKPIAFLAAFLGGFFVDLDHIFDYYMAFDFKLNLNYFLKGYQFLKTDKIYTLLHAWEWVFLLLLVAYLISKNNKLVLNTKKILLSIILSFLLALFSHLLIDAWVNHVTFLGYSIIYRVKNNFDLKKLVTAEHYKKHQMEKTVVKF